MGTVATTVLYPPTSTFQISEQSGPLYLETSGLTQIPGVSIPLTAGKKYRVSGQVRMDNAHGYDYSGGFGLYFSGTATIKGHYGFYVLDASSTRAPFGYMDTDGKEPAQLLLNELMLENCDEFSVDVPGFVFLFEGYIIPTVGGNLTLYALATGDTGESCILSQGKLFTHEV